jgi:hypothetical protein
LGFVDPTSEKTSPDLVQFYFGNGSLEAKQQSIVEVTRVIDAIFVSNQYIESSCYLKELIPVEIIAGQSGDFLTKNNAHFT